MVADRLDKRKNKLESILDVGIGTGHPMKQIYHRIPKDTKIVGIDIDRNYLRFFLYFLNPFYLKVCFKNLQKMP
jgi:ubiquinone/menaquinone biosynthesis C-methylase UbiE